VRRITLWSLSTITILVLLFSYRTSTSSMATSRAAAGQNGGEVAANGPVMPGDPGASSGTKRTPGNAASSSAGSSSSTRPRPTTKSYTGTAIDTQYGPVQVRITVAGGKVTNARVTQVPWNGGTDREINGHAVPILNKEAVQAQNARIDMVSGATFTSDGYIQSLQSAIDRAHL
jgi:uncharacterized protein with FMN-binding domain